MIKRRLAHSENGTLIGSGCCGEVYETNSAGSVVKRFNSMSIDRRFIEENAFREERMPREPGLVEVFDFCFRETPYSLLMERLGGPCLEEVHGLRESEAWKLIRQLADALGHAHKYGVAHGHLHPGNVLMTDRDGETRPVVTDFGTGLVGDIHHIDLHETTYYSAPEQLMPGGSDWRDGRVQKWDVYSFGAIAFKLVNDRLPRGLKYLKSRDREIARSGGRPVPVEPSEFLVEVYDAPDLSWGMSLKVSRELKLFREIIEDCLLLNPDERPVDMREVRNRFRALDGQFALEDAEDRVVKERRKQKTKLISARVLALCLGASFLGATYYLIDYLQQTYVFQNKVTELDQVVVTQQAHIEHLDDRWAETVTDLKSSREAADDFFQKMAGGNNAGGSGVAALGQKDLEKSRSYYLKTLEDVSKEDDTALERARALHSLAHIERRLEMGQGALTHFKDAISAFGMLDERFFDDPEVSFDVHMRLADSYENTVMLLNDPIGHEALTSLRHAVEHFDRAIELKPGEIEMKTRLAGTSFMLGQALDAHQDFDGAIDAYSRSATFADALRTGESDHTEALTELIGKLQYHAAHSLRMAGRIEDSINAHIAGMETVEELRSVNGFTPVQSVQLASTFIELGELFAMREAESDELDQMFNEALRLLTPLNAENPGDVEVAMLQCRSLIHLGQLEREEGRWSAGFKLSARGIENLVKALEMEPDDAPGMLVLAESRLEHLRFFDHEDDSALKIALLGVETAEGARTMLEEEGIVREPLLTPMRNRLGRIFKRYGEICEALGEGGMAKKCFDHAAIEVSSVDRDPDVSVQ